MIDYFRTCSNRKFATMEYLIRFSQSHETFRLPEIQALAELGKIDMKVIYYHPEVSSKNTCSAYKP